MSQFDQLENSAHLRRQTTVYQLNPHSSVSVALVDELIFKFASLASWATKCAHF
jgi:hypothetical protein